MRFLLAAAAFSAAALSPGISQAANPGFCHHYADVAVRQFHHAIETGCIGGPNVRWHGNWDTHYSWCLGADYAAAEHEDEIRGHHLHECRM
jgi:hypothetical protein